MELRTTAICKEHKNHISCLCFHPKSSYIKEYLPSPKGKLNTHISIVIFQVTCCKYFQFSMTASEDILFFLSKLKLFKNISFFSTKIKLSKNRAGLVVLSLAEAGLQNFSPSLSQTPEILSKWSKLVLSKS